MKSEKRPNKESKEKIEFPILMEYVDKDFVVLFKNERQGMVVHSLYKQYPVGHNDENWASVHNKEVWTPYKGSIVLSSE